MALPEILAALLLADLASGVLHWVEDTYCRVGMGGWLGERVCDPNLRHHAEQAEFLGGGLVGRNWTTWLAALPVLLMALVVGSRVLVLAALVGAWSNEVHAWQHRRGPAWVRVLQEMGLLQGPHHHARHHRAPHTSCYCVLTPWCNPLLDRAGFWRGMEFLVRRLLGLAPRS